MPGPQYTLRPLRPDDDPHIEDVIRTVLVEFEANRPGFAWADPELSRLSSVYGTARAAYWVVEHPQRGLRGGAGFGPLVGEADHVCELQKMYLLPAGRGLGAGRALITHCLDAARSAGYTQMYLETLRSMTAAQALYRSVGFQPLAQPMGRTGHGGCDCWFACTLAPDA